MAKKIRDYTISVISFSPNGWSVLSLYIQNISLFLRVSNRFCTVESIKSMGVTVIGCNIPECSIEQCLETPCRRKPFLILARCLFILLCKFWIVRPTYWHLQMHCSTYTTYEDWHVRLWLIWKTSSVWVEEKVFALSLISTQHWHFLCLHLKTPLVLSLFINALWRRNLLGAKIVLRVGGRL